MADRVLAKSVNLTDPETGRHSFPAYTPESDIPEELREQITNPKAWLDAEGLEERLKLPPGMTKQDLINALKATGELTEEDFNNLRGDAATNELNKLTVPELRALAEDNEVDLGAATKKAEIVEVLTTAGVTVDETDDEDAG